MRFAPFVALVFAGFALTCVLDPGLGRAEDQPLSDKQQEAVKKIVHDYLVEHPEAIMDAIGALREKERQAAEDSAKQTLSAHRKDLTDDPNSQVFGNPAGDVTIVEFFDYHCPYCKAMADTVLNIVNTDGKVRLVMKELPILGPDSVFASRAAIASRNQNLYPVFHTALMHLHGPLSESTVMQTAASVGLNVDRLKKDMGSREVDSIISTNLDLARTLNIDGTPGWVFGDKMSSGAMSPEAFKQLIEDARKSKS
jgi:protein-disulfide isomerase